MLQQEVAIRILIADDSVLVRKVLKQIFINNIPACDVNVASNGRFALEKLSQTKPDLLVIDLDITQHDALEILKVIKSQSLRTRCLVLFEATKSNAVRGVMAMRLGAMDILQKPHTDSTNELEISSRYLSVVESSLHRFLSEVGSGQSPKSTPEFVNKTSNAFTAVDIKKFKPRIIVIASSTGGPDALDRVLAAVRPGFALPILIAQHMPAYFTAALAMRLGEQTGIPAAEGKHGERIERGRIYVAPGDFHMSIKMDNDIPTIEIDQTPPVLFVRPAANKLLNSAAHSFPGQTLGIVLTGMGQDGAEGAVNLKRQGCAVVIQDQASCIVWGMPGSVYEQNAYDVVANPEEIAQLIVACAS